MKAFKVGVTALVCISIMGLMSCATLFANKTPEVRMQSDPDGATVYVNGNNMGKTPVNLQLAADKPYTTEFRRDGYQTKVYHLNNHVRGVWIVLDILGGFWPIVIDLATGSWYEFDSTDVKANLDR